MMKIPEEQLYSKEYEKWLTSAVPNERQMEILRMGYYNFVHFGINTFTGKEWGSGSERTERFALKQLDTDRWVLDFIATGSKGVILTAKHHDGFCLFPSRYTDYSIKNTPFMGGNGDIVGQLATSCKKYHFSLGIYLSPWDRHEKTYGTEAYNDFFAAQLEELCTSYGALFCFWFDGACGEDANDKKQRYDWQRYYEVIHKYQPSAAISNCGPDIRWIGNEAGHARQSEWSVVSTRLRAQDAVGETSQQNEADAKRLRKIDATNEDLGSRKAVNGENICYYPSEMDISASRIGWFYRRKFELFFARSVAELVKCYYSSVGNNATLLINVAPNKRGALPHTFIRRLVKMQKRIKNDFSVLLSKTYQVVTDREYLCECQDTISKVILAEDISYSQRVEEFSIEIDGNEVYHGYTIGYQKFCIFTPVKANSVSLKILSCRLEPHILRFELYR